ncbi:MAG: PAS domain S-box protein [Deltaproteobacteria bacterium]|nr:PAS domain S-box protein [Deltaproteobacteria bacterium]
MTIPKGEGSPWNPDSASVLTSRGGEGLSAAGACYPEIDRLKTALCQTRRFQSLVENSRDVIYETDASGHFTFLNPAAEKVTGFAPQQLLGRHYLELIREDFRREARRFYDRQFVKELPDTVFEFPLLARDGREIWIEQHVQIVRENGRITGFQAVARDISRRKSVENELLSYKRNLEGIVKARTREWRLANEALEREIGETRALEAALRWSESHLNAFIQSSPDAIIETNEARILLDCNPAFEQLFGYGREEVLHKPARFLYASKEDYRSFGERVYPDILETGYWRGEWEFRRKDGTLIPTELVAFRVPDQEGSSQHFMSILRDITDRKGAERGLQKAVNLTRQIIQSLSAILIAVDRGNRVMFWNLQAEKEFGFGGLEAQGRCLTQLPLSWDMQAMEQAIDRCRQETRSLYLEKVRFRQVDGKGGFLGISLHPVFGEEFNGLGVLIHGFNVTHRLLLERQLAQAQRLESIGSLAAGIAHEINTPAQYVGDNTRFVQEAFQNLQQIFAKYSQLAAAVKQVGDPQPLLEELEEARQRFDLDYLLDEIPRAVDQTLEGVDRIRTIVKSIKDFAHPGSREKTLVDLNKAIENTVMVSRNEWKYVAELRTELDPQLPLVPAISGEINQVILNLIVNAAQAIAGPGKAPGRAQGRITLRTRQEGRWVELEIQDTGAGIPESIRAKIFDPFFTTKEVGRGTGQGLAICHTIVVDKHQGAISFDSEVDRGTVFRVRLPLEEQRK